MKYLYLFVPFLLLLSCSKGKDYTTCEPSLGKYVYLDSTNVLHIIELCSGQNGEGIKFVKVKDLESDSTRRFCPYCVSDSVYEQIDSAIKSNKERWHY